MESLSNSRRIAYTALACCYAGNHKGITVFHGHSDSNLEKPYKISN